MQVQFSTEMPAKLHGHLNNQMLKSVEHVDAIAFDLLDFLSHR